MAENQKKDLPVPGSDIPSSEVFDFPFLLDQPTIDYLNGHGHVMFIIRGPSGTGKETLGDMILSKYPAGKIVSAKDYFGLPLSVSRGKGGAKASHDWCFKKATDACKAGTRIIIARNTNIRRWEIERYLHLSQDYGYTTIIADASKKFQFDAEVLAKSNTQGLNATYFQSRLRQWDEIVPWYTGWFLNPADSKWLENEATKCLSSLLTLPQFRDDFNFSSDTDFDSYYKNERELFCIAGFCSCEKSGEPHYLNKNVQAELGKMSVLMLRAFLFSSEMILAVVSLSSEQHHISKEGKPEHLDSSDQLSKMFQKLEIKSRHKPQNVTSTPTTSQQTVTSEEQDFDDFLITNLSYIVIKHNSTKPFPYIKDIDAYSAEIFSTLKEQNSIPKDKFLFSTSVAKACQLKKQMTWLVCPFKKYSVQSIFTGLYS